MSAYVLRLQDLDRAMIPLAGGKGASLGELARIPGVRVPDGFCVTTAAYKRITADNPRLDGLLGELARLGAGEGARVGAVSAEIRAVIERIPVADDIAAEIAAHVAALGAGRPLAVRSSATAEDLPTASFAGQQDTYLNVLGEGAVLEHVRRCWASLFTERAAIYRLRQGFDHRAVSLAVVVQEMIAPTAAGILFTADPVTSNRKVSSIDASFGLGEALVSGRVNADVYKVRDGQVIEKKIATKKLAIYAREGGGTREQEIEPERQDRPALTDEQAAQLERVGRTIEAHFGCPQDIEWCLAGDALHVVQSRPITTLFPIPEAGDRGNRVYISVGHQQMMTDPIKPLGLSFYLMTTRAPMRAAGGRLFVDVTPMLASPASRQAFIAAMGRAEPLLKDALATIAERGDFLPPPPDPGKGAPLPPSIGSQPEVEADPAIVADLIKAWEGSLEAAQRAIEARSGPELFDFIEEDIKELQRLLTDPRSLDPILGAMGAAAWINEKMREWLGEKNAADALAQSVPNNVTSEMGLALLDVADAIRPHPEVIRYLQQVRDDGFLDGLAALAGGREARAAIDAYLDRYGMRCVGEIDLTRPRWRESPSALVPLILSNVRSFAPGAGKRRFEQGLQGATAKERELLERLAALPDGAQRAAETRRKIRLIRDFSGFREYPKYGMVSRYFAYKQALLREADRLVQAGALREREDIYYLSFQELREAVRAGRADQRAIDQRKEAHALHEKLRPPRVITSDGEIVTGRYSREDLPAGAIAGLAVSSGVIEGRARVLARLEGADLEDGDILVTSFTDPSWTPLFVSVKGLVTEVGGLMTHGAVIAREYGLPAVVGVEDATRLIRDGQRIRVNGTDGYVELL